MSSCRVLAFGESSHKIPTTTDLLAAPPDRQAAPPPRAEYAPDTLGHHVEPAAAVFGPDLTVADAVGRLRELVEFAFITYAYVADPHDRRLIGILVMRDLPFARPDAPPREVMLRDPFSLRPEMPVMEAMRAVLNRHYPV